MILTRLALVNFRQYAGEHVIDIPEEATIAVVGRNGAGKTTLFQAIEWCLYGHAPAGELATHGTTGETRVAVTLRDHLGVDWVVERTAGKRGDRAAVAYRADLPEAPLAQGKAPVTEYVSRKLIGLGHKAFVSTFFTRQKELAFLSEYPPTQRRREVMKLLGYDAIWGAQAESNEQKKAAIASAKSEAARLDAEYGGRNMRQEVAAAAAAARERESEAATAEAAHAAAVAAHAAAQADLDRWRDLEGGFRALQIDLTRIRGESAVAMQAAGAARDGLRRLDAEAERRVGIAAVAALEPERAEAVARWEAERRHSEEAERLRKEREKTERGLASIASQLQATVGEIDPGERLPDWRWTAADAADVPPSAGRLLDAIDSIDVVGICARAEKLAQLDASARRRRETASKVERYTAAREGLRRERLDAVESGDPEAELAAAIASREAADRRWAAAGRALGIAQAEVDRIAPLVARLDRQVVGDRCPTCDRPFTDHDLGATLDYLRERLARAEADKATAESAQRTAAGERAAADADETAARRRQAAIAKLDERITAAGRHIEDAEHDAWAAEEEHARKLVDLGLVSDPDAGVVATEAEWATVAQALARARSGIDHARNLAVTRLDELADLRARVEALGPLAYDHQAHRDAVRAHHEARDAAARVSEIDVHLARRPDYERTLEEAEARIAALGVETEAVAAAQSALGFDQQALASAAALEQTARAEERAADGRLAAARRVAEDARKHHDGLADEERRVLQRAREIERLQREADNLQRMYDEFSAFDRYVAGLVAPEIADRTADYLAAVTDGHYERVELTEDFGLRVFDDGEAFAIESFSGGERDIAALCARLALSSVIAAQADVKRPPEFLVLDEVFGSLDQDRRRLVLETLGRLTGDDGDGSAAMALRQLFIISHIEDVNESEIVDEAWRVVEERNASRVIRGLGGPPATT